MGARNLVALIDNQLDTAEVIQMILSSDVNLRNVRLFSTGKEFLAEFQPQAYDLILLDLRLPELDGYAVIREVQKIDASVPVIALSASQLPGDRQKAIAAGFTDFVVKPILGFGAFRRLVFNSIPKPHAVQRTSA